MNTQVDRQRHRFESAITSQRTGESEDMFVLRARVLLVHWLLCCVFTVFAFVKWHSYTFGELERPFKVIEHQVTSYNGFLPPNVELQFSKSRRLRVQNISIHMPLRHHTMPDFARVVSYDPFKLAEYAKIDTLTGLSTIHVKAPEVCLMPDLSEYMRIVVDCDPVNRDEMYRIILKNPKSNTPNSQSNIYEFQPGKVMELRYRPVILIHEIETNLTFLEKAAKYFGYARKQTVHDYHSWITVTSLDSNENPKVNVSRKAEFIFRLGSNRMSSKEFKPVSPSDNTAGQSSATSPGAAHPDVINIIEMVQTHEKRIEKLETDVKRIEKLEKRVDKLRTWLKVLMGSIIDSEFLQFLRNCFAAVKRQLKYKDSTSLEAASPSTALRT
ncbi:hypothetical protein BGW42_004107 [Actinomortierella wolfii]|nr:hypothetical protein BGW42_004107 [Actinomortierella wolfii]